MPNHQINWEERDPGTMRYILNYYFRNWGKNPSATTAQREEFGEAKLKHERWGYDHENRLVLIGEGFDGKPMGSAKWSVARRYFGNIENLIPPDVDIVRFGLFFHLGFYRTVMLVVKNQWERFVCQKRVVGQWERCKRSKKCEEITSDVEKSKESAFECYECIVTRFTGHDLDSLVNSFSLGLNGHADAAGVYTIFEQNGSWASSMGYTSEQFKLMLFSLIDQKIIPCDLNSPELERFISDEENRVILLKSSSNEEQQTFWIKKCQWTEIRRDIGDKLLTREAIRLRQHNINIGWLSVFGELFRKVMELQFRCAHLERRIAIRETDPNITEEEINKLVEEAIKQAKKEMEELQDQLIKVHIIKIIGPMGGPLPPEEAKKYEEEVKKVLREIWKLTSPDGARIGLPFTKKQQDELTAYFRECTEIKNSETGLTVRSLPVLNEILAAVEEIYKLCGVDIPPDSVIKGETIAKQLAWLETEIVKLEKQISELRGEMSAMEMNRDIQEKQASMATDESKEETRAALESRQNDLTLLQKELEARYLALSKKEVLKP